MALEKKERKSLYTNITTIIILKKEYEGCLQYFHIQFDTSARKEIVE